MFEKIVLPNGRCLHYHQLHLDPQTGNWLFTYGGRPKPAVGVLARAYRALGSP